MIKGMRRKKYEELFNGQLNDEYKDSDITGTEPMVFLHKNKFTHGNGLLL